MAGAHSHTVPGRDGALRGPRRVQRRNHDFKSPVLEGNHCARWQVTAYARPGGRLIKLR